MYYAAELRLIPTWNPIGRGSRLDWLDIAWIQLVPFVEVGRVREGPGISASCTVDMKLDVGVGFRALVKGLVVRVGHRSIRRGGRRADDGRAPVLNGLATRWTKA